MPKRKPDSNNYFRITDIGSATKQPDGKWLTDARRKGIPQKLQRKVFLTKKDAKAHLETLKKNLKRYGHLKATNQDFFSDDELTQSRILLEELNEQQERRYTLSDVVDIGVRAETARIKSLYLPLLKDFIAEYLHFRSTPQGKQRGGGTIDKHQLGQEKLFFKSVCSWFGEYRLNEIFAPDTKFKKLAADKLWNDLKQKDGSPYGEVTLKKNAKFLTALLAYALEEHPQLESTNPLNGWHSQFDRQFERKPQMFKIKDVQTLFNTAAGHKKWCDLIPFMAFIFFSGTRPSEVATQEKYRRFQWENMNGWKSLSKVSNGIIFKVPPYVEVDGIQKRMSKKNTYQVRDLVDAGVKWMKWYFEIHQGKKLPISGAIYYSRRHWSALRKECDMFGDNWEDDGARHTFASCAHAHWSTHYEHWLTHIGHRGGVLEKHYQSPDATPEDAEFYFEKIIPPNLQEEEQALKAELAKQEQQAELRAKAIQEARATMKKVLGLEVDDFPNSLTSNGEHVSVKQFFPDWYTSAEEEDLLM